MIWVLAGDLGVAFSRSVSLHSPASSSLLKHHLIKAHIRRRKLDSVFALISLPIEPAYTVGEQEIKNSQAYLAYKSIMHVCRHRLIHWGTNHTDTYIATIAFWLSSKCQRYHMGMCVYVCVCPDNVPSLSAIQCAGINTCLTQQIGTNGFTHSAICKLGR